MAAIGLAMVSPAMAAAAPAAAAGGNVLVSGQDDVEQLNEETFNQGEDGGSSTTDGAAPFQGPGPSTVATGSDHGLAVMRAERTTTTLTASPEQPYAGDPATLTAAVTCTAGTPTGTVTFTDNGQDIGSASLDADGTASLVTDDLAEGRHTLGAHYEGSTACAASDAECVCIVICERCQPSTPPTSPPTSPPVQQPPTSPPAPPPTPSP
ncbi:Ig-like domain-containing protein, partial [Streptomyces jeddahensis]|uniref:Ig-like domain-containing protein n=1 Tax=Streptomyces jeddahensis TaxID=1716141 RepID=UPI000B1BED68